MATIPSIAMIPSGVKASKLYSVLPTDGTGDFTTTRASVATRVNENGLIEEVASNVPRLDYSDGTCPSLLLEPASTNLVVQSEDFSNAYWGTIFANPTINNAISPNGQLNATKFNDDNSGGNGEVRLFGSATVNTSSSYTFSCFIKKGTLNDAILRTGNFTTPTNTSTFFDLNLGTVALVGSGHTANIKNYGNGWYRCSITFVTDTVDNSGNVVIGLADGLSASVDRNGLSSVFIYGAQLEENSYATSYIKNAGTALGVTRVADTASGAGNASLINSSEGTLYAEISALSDDLTQKSITISDSSTNNFVRIDYKNATSNTIRGQVRSGGLITASGSTVFSDIKDFHKIAISYKLNDVKLYIDGVLIFTDTSAIMPVGLDTLAFDEEFYGKTKSLQVYTTALSDAELISLTTI